MIPIWIVILAYTRLRLGKLERVREHVRRKKTRTVN